LLDSFDPSGKAIGDRIGDVKQSIKSAAKRAGLKGVAFYLLRHTCASWLAEQEVASLAIRDILDHSTVKMSDRYLYSHASHLQESVSVLKAIAR
jgi:integrase